MQPARFGVVAAADEILRAAAAAALTGLFERVIEVHRDQPIAPCDLERADLIVIEYRSSDTTGAWPFGAFGDVGHVPSIVVVSDRGQGLRCLESGASDFVRRPLQARELRARAQRRVAERFMGHAPVSDGLRLSEESRTVRIGRRVVLLTEREFGLLSYLASQPGRALARRQLLERVWGSSPEWQQLRTVTEHVYRLRQKIEIDPSQPSFIITVPGFGYRLDASIGLHSAATGDERTGGPSGGPPMIDKGYR